jgi:hypothetical protein
MNKELTPLEALHSLVEIFATKKYDEKGNLIYWENILDTLSKNGEYRIIEKALKTLEILALVLDLNTRNRIALRDALESGWITQEQYDLVDNTLKQCKENKDEKNN